jgi:hypothetical protein
MMEYTKNSCVLNFWKLEVGSWKREEGSSMMRLGYS